MKGEEAASGRVLLSARGYAHEKNGSNVRLLRLPEVKVRTALSRSELYRRIAAGTFPPPVKLGERACAWVDAEISAWCEARIAARDAKGAA